MRIVLDTNVLLAGIATHGMCEGLLRLCYRDHAVVLSEHILVELREHYVGKFKATDEQAARVVDALRMQSEVVIPITIPSEAFKDADDLPVLGTAISGQVDYLVTGDKQLQELSQYRKIPIVSPSQFYELLRTAG